MFRMSTTGTGEKRDLPNKQQKEMFHPKHTFLLTFTPSCKKKTQSIPFIFNDESTGSCICLRLDIYMSQVKITCATADSFCSLFPYPPTTCAPTRASVTHMKDNVSRSFEIRQVIHDTCISNGQWPQCDVTKCAVTKVIRSNLDPRHIHVK
jgi:hypothetical protein